MQTAVLYDKVTQALLRETNVEIMYLHALNPHGFSWWRRVTHENVDLAQAGHRRRENHTGGCAMNARASLTVRLMAACAWCDALLDLSRTEGLTWIYILKTVGAALLSLGIAMKLEFVNGFNAQMTAVFAG
jgi:Protein of unknown function (DUF2817)